MAVPARPVSGAPIESAWGGVVHDTAVALDIQSGVATLIPNTTPNGLTQVLTVTFPRPFASAPAIVATVVDVGTGSVNVNAGVVSRTGGTQFQLGARDIRETIINYNVPVAWVAIGPRA